MKKGEHDKRFLSFKEARMLVRKFNLRGWRGWLEYSRTKRPLKIPSQPWVVYSESWVSISDWTGNKCIKMASNNRKYKINLSFFKTWSNDMAYILGFWFADGCINKTTFTISQHKKDKSILEDISLALSYSHPLIKQGNSNNFNICIYSKEIVDSIKALGGKERKSLDVKFPTVPRIYLSDFIRGYFDGDGSISISKDGKRYYTSFATGSRDFASGLLCKLRENILSLKGGISEKSNKNNKIKRKDGAINKQYSVWFSKNDAIKLRIFMYSSKSKLLLVRKRNLMYSMGNICIIKQGFLSYDDAKRYVSSLGIRNSYEWNIYSKSGKRPYYLPSTPDRSYKESGWVSWEEWLGHKIERKHRNSKKDVASYSR